MILPVRLFIDPVLHKPTELITNFGSEELYSVAQDMIESMGAYRGIGLSANQININKQLFVANIVDKSQLICVANPVIICYNKEWTEELEGCLSAPNISVKMKRPTWVEFEYQKLNGEKDKMRLEGYNARIFFHEYSHLQGQMIIDNIARL